MVRSNIPVYIDASREVRERLGKGLEEAARLAIRAILKNSRGLEVAYQQITYRGHHLALSSRVTSAGDLAVAIALGDPALASRLILEDELQSAERRAREITRNELEANRKLRVKARRW
jgi:hypothetical protein